MHTPQFRPADLNRAAPLLGGISPAYFMERFWQREPLLIRQALPGLTPPLDRAQLFDLAGNDAVETRLVRQQRGRWRVAHGPFDSGALPSVRTRQWTLLVQGVDLHDDAAAALLDRFRFIPNARLDDLMISYASDQGGVGPHVDSYDVFLLQLQGRRRWRIARQADLSLRDDTPLKILRNFEPQDDWVLEPGDMLYLPPHIAHDGVAEGECMTASIGFRAPAPAEVAGQFFYDLAERLGESPLWTGMRYRDPGRAPSATPAALPEDMIDTVGTWLERVKWSRDDLADFMGRYLSEPKPQVVFAGPRRPLAPEALLRRASREGLRLDRKSSLLYRRGQFFINGESCEAPAGARAMLRRLGDWRMLEGKDFVTLSHDSCIARLLHEWYLAGWVQVGLASNLG